MKNLLKSLAGLMAVLILGSSLVSCKQEDSGIDKSVIMINVVPPVKTTYGIGQSLDKTGMVVTAVWNDGTSQTVTDYTVTGFDSSKAAASQDITVTYCGKKASFRVKIIEIESLPAKPVRLEITEKPAKLVYTTGEKLNLDGMVVEMVYNDNGKEEKEEVEDYITRGFDSSTYGIKTVTVIYTEDGYSFTASYEVNVITLKEYLNNNIQMVQVMSESRTVTGSGRSGVFKNGRTVTLSPYEICKYEVTQELYAAIMGKNPSFFTMDVADGEIQFLRPVERVNWYDAITFCNKLTLLFGLTEEDLVYSVEGITDWGSLSAEEVPSSSSTAWDNATIDLTKKGYRLPTEAEWEFAARGGDTSASEWNYTYAGSDSPDDVAWYYSNSSDMTHQVGKKLPNSLGLYDMSGNVWEWCNDWYGSIGTGSETDPVGAVSGDYRCPRGGSWYNTGTGCEVYTRSRGDAYYRYFIGFRLARTAE